MHRIKRIGIIMGSFDPIHIGHLELADLVLSNNKNIDEVSFQPAWQNVFKTKSTDFGIRLNMCEKAIQGMKGVTVSAYEALLRYRTKADDIYTIDVINNLLLEEKENFVIYHLICTQETYKEIPSWKSGEEILKKIPILLEGRDFPTHSFNIHSTFVRKLAEEHKNLVPYVTESVQQIIQYNKLYIK